nr:hypothetical protein [Pseudonocardia terrae]
MALAKPAGLLGPVLYFVDADGRIRHHHFGEEDYERSERVIQQLLAEAGRDDVDRDLVSVEPGGVFLAADWTTLRSPETYVGYARATGFASPTSVAPDRSRAYDTPSRLALNQWALAGEWTVGDQITTLDEPGGRIVHRFHGRDLNLVLGGAACRCASGCGSTGRRRRGSPGSTSTSGTRARSTRSGSTSSSVRTARSPTAPPRSPSSTPAPRPTCSPSASDPRPTNSDHVFAERPKSE